MTDLRADAPVFNPFSAKNSAAKSIALHLASIRDHNSSHRQPSTNINYYEQCCHPADDTASVVTTTSTTASSSTNYEPSSHRSRRRERHTQAFVHDTPAVNKPSSHVPHHAKKNGKIALPNTNMNKKDALTGTSTGYLTRRRRRRQRKDMHRLAISINDENGDVDNRTDVTPVAQQKKQQYDEPILYEPQQLQPEESFPLLAHQVIPAIHEVWTLTDRIQTNVAREWDPTEDNIARKEEDDSENIADILGLTWLNGHRASKSRLIDLDNGGEADNAEISTENVATGITHRYRRRRLDISKLRDKMFDTISSRLVALEATEAAAHVKKSAAASETAASTNEQESARWEYVELSRPTAPEPLPPLDPSYHECENPLHQAIEKNDEKAVKLLLRNENSISTAAGSSPIQLAVARSRPRLLKFLLRSQHIVSIPDGPDYPPAPHVATRNGSDECLQLLLSHSLNYALSKDIQNGSNLLHICCSRSVRVSTLQLVLYVISKGSSEILTKAMLSLNDRNETPLHIACRNDLTAHVDVLLSSLRATLLSKLFRIKDVDEQTPFLAAVASGSTNVVMGLSMRRRNNQIQILPKSVHCPLAWAVKARNVEMVMLLLEFNDPGGRGYDLAGALRVTLEGCDVFGDDDSDDEVVAELCRVLVQAGANPCESTGATGVTSLVRAVKMRSVRAVACLIDAYDSRLEQARNERRRDPILQKQPESFFAGMESREKAERGVALRDTIVAGIFQFYSAEVNSYSKSISCVQALFRREGQLGPVGLLRLKQSITANSLQLDPTPPILPEQIYTYYVTHLTALCPSNEMHWSTTMLHMPWIASDGPVEECSCLFARANFGRGSVPRPDVTIISDDGHHFVAHAAVLSERSDKLSAAIRFDQMTKTESGMLEIGMEVSSELCLLLLEHVYHGSMLTFEVNRDDPVQSVHQLLDLLVLADEYIMPSLTQECVMRLLSDSLCPCFCRSCTKQVYDHSSAAGYQISGPSACIKADTCLDILAVVQHLKHQGSSCTSSLLVKWEEPSLWGSNNRHEMSVDALDAVQEAVNRYILLHFGDLLRGNHLDEHVCFDATSDTFSDNHKASQLLRMCLDNYVRSPIGVAERNSSTAPARPATVSHQASAGNDPTSLSPS